MGLGGSPSRRGPVFLDPTGLRRRLVILAGLTIALLLLSLIALVVAAALGATPLPLPGLPQSGQGAQREPTIPVAVQPSGPSSRSATPGPTTPAVEERPGGSAAPVAPTPSSAAASSRGRGNRPSQRPDNPHPGKSK